MDQKIFEQGFPVETVSLYLMMTGLADMGEVLTLEKMEAVWNGNSQDLRIGLSVLKDHGILEMSDEKDSGYLLLPSEAWKKT